MKLSQQTIDVLRWCSHIQKDLLIEPGNRLRTISSNKATLLEANIRETFPARFAVRDFSRCLAFLDETTDVMFDDPTYLGLRNGRVLSKVPSSEEALVFKPPSTNIKISQFDESFFLHSDDVYELRRLKGDKVLIEFHASGPDDKIRIDHFEIGESGDPTPLRHTMEMVKTHFAKQRFRARFKLRNIKLVEGSYQLAFSAAGVCRFNWLHGDAVVWIAIEAAHSYFGEPPPLKPTIEPTPTTKNTSGLVQFIDGVRRSSFNFRYIDRTGPFHG
jgi:hypothetical protein